MYKATSRMGVSEARFPAPDPAAAWIAGVPGHPAYCRMLSSGPGLHPLDAGGNPAPHHPSGVTTKTDSRHYQVSPVGHHHLLSTMGWKTVSQGWREP